MLSFAILALTVALFLSPGARQAFSALSTTQNSYHTVATSTNQVGSTPVEMMDRNDTRAFAQCVNNGAVDAYCAKVSAAGGMSTSSALIVKSGGGTFVYDMNDPYMGGAFCRTSTGTTTMACEER